MTPEKMLREMASEVVCDLCTALEEAARIVCLGEACMIQTEHAPLFPGSRELQVVIGVAFRECSERNYGKEDTIMNAFRSIVLALNGASPLDQFIPYGVVVDINALRACWRSPGLLNIVLSVEPLNFSAVARRQSQCSRTILMPTEQLKEIAASLGIVYSSPTRARGDIIAHLWPYAAHCKDGFINV